MLLSNCSSCSQPSKYKCPACNDQSCSVACVKSHKVRTGCTGQVDPTAFLPKDQLLSAASLDRDYNFLQRITRDIHVDKSDARSARVNKPRDLWRAGARVHSMGFGMSRKKRNQSRWNASESQFEWTVEVITGKISQFIQLGDKTLVSTLMERFGYPPEFSVMLRNAFGTRVELNKTQTFQDAVRGKDVLEFPTIEFVAPDPTTVSWDSESDSSSGSSSSDDDSGSEDDIEENSEQGSESKTEEPFEIPDAKTGLADMQHEACLENVVEEEQKKVTDDLVQAPELPDVKALDDQPTAEFGAVDLDEVTNENEVGASQQHLELSEEAPEEESSRA